jgi:hypothetical protein
MSKNRKFRKIPQFPLKKILLEINNFLKFNFSESNIISVQVAKVVPHI